MQPVDRAGTFRANITSYGLKEMDSGAIAVSIRCELISLFHDGEWNDWPNGTMEAEGDIWIVKKRESGGGLNEHGVRSLIDFAGWDGSIESIQNATWQTTRCAVVVQEDTYKDNKRFRIAFVNDYERTPGGLSNIDQAKAKALQSQYGAQLRALAGNKQRNGAAPAGKPPAPPLPKPTRDLNAPPVAVDANDIPF